MKTLLLVEDDATYAGLLTDLVQRMGFDVVPAGTVSEACVAAHHDGFDAALLDFQLPDGDARDVIDCLERAPAPTPPVLVVSSDSAAPGLLPQGTDFFPKPLDTRALRTKLDDIAQGAA